MQPPPVCTALHLTHFPYQLNTKAKPRLPSSLPCNAAPLQLPMRAPPLCTDDIRHDERMGNGNGTALRGREEGKRGFASVSSR
jgi:hypothetical protein